MSFLTNILFTAVINVSASGLPSCTPPELRNTLDRIEQQFGELNITSHFRPGAIVAGTKRRSFHAKCKAVDFNVPSHKYWDIVLWLKREHKGGIGTYSCGKNHIHIDSGPSRHWHTCVDKRMHNDVAMTASINRARRAGHHKATVHRHNRMTRHTQTTKGKLILNGYTRRLDEKNSQQLNKYRRTKTKRVKAASLRRMFDHANKP